MSKHFEISEMQISNPIHGFDIDINIIPEEYIPNTEQLFLNLEVIRKEAGNQPLRIVSGYRSEIYNKKVKGAKNSYHKKAMAADLIHFKLSPRELYEIIIRLIDEGKISEGGVGLYNSFVHYDNRGYKARW